MIQPVKKLFGIVGHPLTHSLSPAMHNAVFRKLNLNCEYLALDTTKENLENTIKNAKTMGFVGLNITIPYKTDVLKYINNLSKEAELIGAVNTIHYTNKEITGYNTDGTGCLNALKESGEDVKNKRVFIIGAGGAARAIAFQCVLNDATVSLTNRKEGRLRAENLIKDIKIKLNKNVEFIELNDETLKNHLKEVDILVQTTPVGMKPDIDNTIISGELIPKNVTVMDIVYNPPETRLLREAKKKGCKTIDGVGMLVHQGAKSLNIWLGINPPIDIMKKTVISELRDKRT